MVYSLEVLNWIVSTLSTVVLDNQVSRNQCKSLGNLEGIPSCDDRRYLFFGIGVTDAIFRASLVGRSARLWFRLRIDTSAGIADIHGYGSPFDQWGDGHSVYEGQEIGSWRVGAALWHLGFIQ